MPAHAQLIIERLRDGFWAIPSAALLVAVLLGLLMPTVDYWLAESDAERRWLDEEAGWLRVVVFNAGPEGARATLQAVSGSSITVAATIFSITIATLALVSNQFGPRLLRNFTSDRGVQISMAAFVFAFVYPITVLRTVRGDAATGDAFVPHLSVTLALFTGLAAVGVLVYFIDHVSTMIRAPRVVEIVGQELDGSVDSAIPADAEEGDSDEDPDVLLSDDDLPHPEHPATLTAERAGYIRVIDNKRLVEIAARRDATLRLEVGPGSYVYEGTVLLRRGKHDVFDDGDVRELADAFAIGSRRTLVQDPVYGFNQLVEIAVRAMSPGVNDPFTAMSCVDRLTASIARLADRPFSDPRDRDASGIVRLYTRRPTFDYLLQVSYAPIRRYAGVDGALMGRMMDGFVALADRVKRPRRMRALRRQADALMRVAESLEKSDAEMLSRKYSALIVLMEARVGKLNGEGTAESLHDHRERHKAKEAR